MPKKAKKSLQINSKETRVFIGVILLIIGTAFAIAPFSEGAQLLIYPLNLFGFSSLLWGISTIALSMRFLTTLPFFQSTKKIIGFYFLSAVTSTLLAFFMPEGTMNDVLTQQSYGGSFGVFFHEILLNMVGKFIEFLLLITLAVISFSMISGTSMEKISGVFDRVVSGIAALFTRKPKEEDLTITASDAMDDTDGKSGGFSFIKKPFIGSGSKDGSEEPLIEGSDGIDNDDLLDDEFDEGENFGEGNTITVTPRDPMEITDNTATQEPRSDTDLETALLVREPQFPEWNFPPLSLLQKPINQKQDQEIHKRNAVLIERTLMSFDIESKVTKITIGPTVVQYALSITVGTKVSKVKNLTNDLALALATTESNIRIETPIPGTSLIGIEIPNPTPNFVYIREIVAEIRNNPDKYFLPLALGKDVAGKIYVKDLVSMPHLLVAGATGTGKSVGVNSILTGLLMTKTPDELRLILVDPKMVEMAPYNDLPHLITPVITDMELVVNALDWAIQEMSKRYRILKQIGVKNIAEYNRKNPEAKMPYILIVIDEMSDLMMSTGVDVEAKILRLAQMARAIGIHLILATQRPDVKVITGVIKANINGRMAFSVSQSIDSRVILDQSGAESLIGKGDMLFKSPDATKAIRLQGAFTSTEDTELLVDFLVKQTQGKPTSIIEEVTNPDPTMNLSTVSGGLNKLSDDPMFGDALDAIITEGKGSSSMLQRKLKIGYNRAARLIDELEAYGAVGPQEGSNPRDVMIRSKEEFIAKLQRQAQMAQASRSEQYDGGSVPEEIFDD